MSKKPVVTAEDRTVNTAVDAIKERFQKLTKEQVARRGVIDKNFNGVKGQIKGLIEGLRKHSGIKSARKDMALDLYNFFYGAILEEMPADWMNRILRGIDEALQGGKDENKVKALIREGCLENKLNDSVQELNQAADGKIEATKKTVGSRILQKLELLVQTSSDAERPLYLSKKKIFLCEWAIKYNSDANARNSACARILFPENELTDEEVRTTVSKNSAHIKQFYTLAGLSLGKKEENEKMKKLLLENPTFILDETLQKLINAIGAKGISFDDEMLEQNGPPLQKKDQLKRSSTFVTTDLGHSLGNNEHNNSNTNEGSPDVLALSQLKRTDTIAAIVPSQNDSRNNNPHNNNTSEELPVRSLQWGSGIKKLKCLKGRVSQKANLAESFEKVQESEMQSFLTNTIQLKNYKDNPSEFFTALLLTNINNLKSSTKRVGAADATWTKMTTKTLTSYVTSTVAINGNVYQVYIYQTPENKKGEISIKKENNEVEINKEFAGSLVQELKMISRNNELETNLSKKKKVLGLIEAEEILLLNKLVEDFVIKVKEGERQYDNIKDGYLRLIAEEVVKKGLKNFFDKNGNTLLGYAAGIGGEDAKGAINILIDAGVNVNATAMKMGTKAELTALDIVDRAKEDDDEDYLKKLDDIEELLKSKGATKRNLTVVSAEVDDAKKTSGFECKDFLQSISQNKYSEIPQGFLSLVAKEVIKQNLLYAFDSEDNTLLGYVVMAGDEDAEAAVKILLEGGVDVEAIAMVADEGELTAFNIVEDYKESGKNDESYVEQLNKILKLLESYREKNRASSSINNNAYELKDVEQHTTVLEKVLGANVGETKELLNTEFNKAVEKQDLNAVENLIRSGGSVKVLIKAVYDAVTRGDEDDKKYKNFISKIDQFLELEGKSKEVFDAIKLIEPSDNGDLKSIADLINAGAHNNDLQSNTTTPTSKLNVSSVDTGRNLSVILNNDNTPIGTKFETVSVNLDDLFLSPIMTHPLISLSNEEKNSSNNEDNLCTLLELDNSYDSDNNDDEEGEKEKKENNNSGSNVNDASPIKNENSFDNENNKLDSDEEENTENSQNYNNVNRTVSSTSSTVVIPEYQLVNGAEKKDQVLNSLLFGNGAIDQVEQNNKQTEDHDVDGDEFDIIGHLGSNIENDSDSDENKSEQEEDENKRVDKTNSNNSSNITASVSALPINNKLSFFNISSVVGKGNNGLGNEEYFNSPLDVADQEKENNQQTKKTDVDGDNGHLSSNINTDSVRVNDLLGFGNLSESDSNGLQNDSNEEESDEEKNKQNFSEIDSNNSSNRTTPVFLDEDNDVNPLIPILTHASLLSGGGDLGGNNEALSLHLLTNTSYQLSNEMVNKNDKNASVETIQTNNNDVSTKNSTVPSTSNSPFPLRNFSDSRNNFVTPTRVDSSELEYSDMSISNNSIVVSPISRNLTSNTQGSHSSQEDFLKVWDNSLNASGNNGNMTPTVSRNLTYDIDCAQGDVVVVMNEDKIHFNWNNSLISVSKENDIFEKLKKMVRAENQNQSGLEITRAGVDKVENVVSIVAMTKFLEENLEKTYNEYLSPVRQTSSVNTSDYSDMDTSLVYSDMNESTESSLDYSKLDTPIEAISTNNQNVLSNVGLLSAKGVDKGFGSTRSKDHPQEGMQVDEFLGVGDAYKGGSQNSEIIVVRWLNGGRSRITQTSKAIEDGKTQIYSKAKFTWEKDDKSVPSTKMKDPTAVKVVGTTLYKPVDIDVDSAWHESKTKSGRGNNLKVVNNVYGIEGDYSEKVAIEKTLLDIIYKVAAANKLTFGEVSKIIREAKDEGGIKNKWVEDENKYSDRVWSDEEQVFFKMAKKFSKEFQEECDACGILSGRGKSNVGLRTTFIPETVLSKIPTDYDIVAEVTEEAKENLRKRKETRNSVVSAAPPLGRSK